MKGIRMVTDDNDHDDDAGDGDDDDVSTHP